MGSKPYFTNLTIFLLFNILMNPWVYHYSLWVINFHSPYSYKLNFFSLAQAYMTLQIYEFN
jgi:hypothetical protein